VRPHRHGALLAQRLTAATIKGWSILVSETRSAWYLSEHSIANVGQEATTLTAAQLNVRIGTQILSNLDADASSVLALFTPASAN
jgi:hypothetical protein